MLLWCVYHLQYVREGPTSQGNAADVSFGVLKQILTAARLGLHGSGLAYGTSTLHLHCMAEPSSTCCLSRTPTNNCRTKLHIKPFAKHIKVPYMVREMANKHL